MKKQALVINLFDDGAVTLGLFSFGESKELEWESEITELPVQLEVPVVILGVTADTWVHPSGLDTTNFQISSGEELGFLFEDAKGVFDGKDKDNPTFSFNYRSFNIKL